MNRTYDKLYEHAQAFVFPSLIEGFGWPPLEANAMGCPVITTRTGQLGYSGGFRDLR